MPKKVSKRQLKLKKVCKYVTGDGEEFNKKRPASKHLNVMKARWKKAKSKKK